MAVGDVERVTLTAGQGEDARSVTLTGEQFDQAVERIVGAQIPSDDHFGEDDFLESQALQQVAEALIEIHRAKLGFLSGVVVRYFWKRKGGKAHGGAVYGKLIKPSGLQKHLAECELILWVAADHCRAADFTSRQLEALVFHELLHAGQDFESGDLILVPHEAEIFAAEVRAYGLWSVELRDVAPSFRQLSLDE